LIHGRIQQRQEQKCNTYFGLRFGFLFNGDMQTLKRKMVLPEATLKNIRLRPGPPGVSGDCKVG